MQKMPTIKELPAITGKKILVRTDFNVPLSNGQVTDTTRITRACATLKKLADQKAKVIILSHLGRPDGKVTPAYSLRQVLPALEKALAGYKVFFAEDCVASIAQDKIRQLQQGQILLLENVRFHAGEEQNDSVFAQKLSQGGDFYVNDAFSCSHRAHASIDKITHFLPSFAGLLMAEEVAALDHILSTPKRPLTAIVGGAKISTKLDLLQNLLSKVDHLVIGGAMANTFLQAQGCQVGKSLTEANMLATAAHITELAKKSKKSLILPVDAVVAEALQANVVTRTVTLKEIGVKDMILDIGPKTVQLINDTVKNSKSVVWNGPLGAFETPPFDQGTKKVAAMIASATQQKNLVSVAGGGDTVSALIQAGVEEKLSYVSSAGGAFLEWLEGKTLPGIQALLNPQHL